MKLRNLTLLDVALGICILLGCGPETEAQTIQHAAGPTGIQPRAGRFDANKNGKLDPAERVALVAELKQVKAKFDKNKDGKLDPAERTAAERAWLAEQHRRKADAKAQVLREFDQDKDGQISIEEKKAMIAEQRRRAASGSEQRGR